MTTKLLATDLDGTLVFNHIVSDADVAAVTRWRETGHILTSCTGKSVKAMQVDIGDSGVIFDYHILNTGALVTDGDYTVLWSQSIPFDVAKDVFDFNAASPNIGLYATTVKDDYTLRPYTGEFRNPELLSHFQPAEIDVFRSEDCMGLVFAIPDGVDADDLYRSVSERYSDILDCHRNLAFIDLVPKGANKGSGIERLLQLAFAHEQVEIFTLGDSWNDLAMHRLADHSITFGYAPRDVQDACNVVVDNVHSWIDAYLNAETANLR